MESEIKTKWLAAIAVVCAVVLAGIMTFAGLVFLEDHWEHNYRDEQYSEEWTDNWDCLKYKPTCITSKYSQLCLGHDETECIKRIPIQERLIIETGGEDE